jgi:ABC-2 type transport system ATP-binding protein
MITAEKLTKRYVGRSAVDAISFEVEKGEVVGFLGQNGAGKTSTLRMLTGYMPPTSGSATVAGYDVFHQSLQARRQIGYMPENVPLYEDMRVKEYLHFMGRLHGMGGKQLASRTGEVMELCRISDVRRKMIASLSKGYRQRVGMAAALVHEPPLLIMDEPTNGLDPNQIRQVRSMIRSLGEEHTILLSTHILPEVEAVCDRVIIIDKGRIRAEGTPGDLVATLRTAGTLFLEVEADPQEAECALARLDGVRKVNSHRLADGWTKVEVVAESKIDVRAAAYAVVAAAGWPLRELVLQKASLEDAFVELTDIDNAA